MTEQQRREQILQMRQQGARPAAPSVPQLSLAEAQQQVSTHEHPMTQEEMIAVAMLGKFVQGNVNNIKTLSVGDNKALSIHDVEMSKVMPSGIMKAMGNAPQQPRISAPAGVTWDDTAPVISSSPSPVPTYAPAPSFSPELPLFAPSAPVFKPVQDDNQLQLEFERKARYPDIVDTLDKLENKVILLTQLTTELNKKLDYLIELHDKKKPKKALIDGSQTG